VASSTTLTGTTRDKAPHAFDDDLEQVVAQLRAHPQLVGRLERDGTRRRVLLRRLRYYLYFRVVDGGERVQILALWHMSRGRAP